MTATKIYMLTCNGYGCKVTFVSCPPMQEASAARGRAEKLGWKHELFRTKFGIAPSLDFCKTCIKNGRRDEVVTDLVAAMKARGQADT